MGAASNGFIATTSLPVVVKPLSAFSNDRRSKLAFSLCINAIAATDTSVPWQAATASALNSSVYRRRLRRHEGASWSIVFTCPPIRGHDAPKAAASI
jgi:hypothetical protein